MNLLRWVWSRLAQEKIPEHPQHWDREHYIPIRPRELLSKLKSIDGSNTGEPNDLDALCESLISLVHLQYHRHHQRLIALYHHCDPDADSISPGAITSDELSQKQDATSRALFSEIGKSIQGANYRRLKPREIQQALRTASYWGLRLRIRFSSFRRLEVYGRGDVLSKRWKRNWRRYFAKCEVHVPIYQRLVVVFQPRVQQTMPELLDPTCVYVRMFKNIPKADVDMMLPGTQVGITWMDTGKIGIPTAWGMVMLVSKLVKSLWLLTLIGALKILSSFVLILAIVVASIFYGVKSIFSYTTAKRRHMLNVTRNLYYQNLDNNLGALLRLNEEAEQQETCEALLAYYVLLRGNGTAATLEAIDQEAERLLKAMTGYAIDFDVRDAIRDLLGMGIVQAGPDGWSALPISQAVEVCRSTPLRQSAYV